MNENIMNNNMLPEEGNLVPAGEDACVYEDMAQMREELERMAMEEDGPVISLPVWLGKQGIHEQRFIREFLREMPLRRWNGVFHSVDGEVQPETIRHMIYRMVSPFVSRNTDRIVTSLYTGLTLAAMTPPPAQEWGKIHVANGTIRLMLSTDPDGGDRRVEVSFTPEKEFCTSRLPIEYRERTETPMQWFYYLAELLEELDVDTLQEYLGYMLIPTNKAQKMLFILGKGGEGKSVLGTVLRELFGSALWFGSIQKMETNRFARADLAGKLAMIDDDMQMEALTQTGTLKSMVTATGKMDVERKGQQSTQEDMFCRFLCLGNGTLSALHDRTNGFYRRQIILRTKERPRHRVDDPYLSDRLLQEKEGIFLWILAGLVRLLENDFRFTISDSARTNLQEAWRDANNILDFLREGDRLTYDPEGSITSHRLCILYRKWCEDNGLKPLSDTALITYLKENARKYSVEYSRSIPEDGKKLRGFRGVRGI